MRRRPALALAVVLLLGCGTPDALEAEATEPSSAPEGGHVDVDEDEHGDEHGDEHEHADGREHSDADGHRDPSATTVDAASVLFGRPTVRGAITPELLLRVARRRRGGLRRCAERASLEGPASMTLHLALNSTGAVVRARVSAAPPRTNGLARCVVRAAERWAFPAESCGIDLVELPLTFAVD